MSEPKHTYSAPIIDEFTKTSKINPLNEMPLDPNWRIEDYDIDSKLSRCKAVIPMVDGSKQMHSLDILLFSFIL